MKDTAPALDPVTFEVFKNAFISAVDQMAEQMPRTCHSFAIFNRDFSNGLHDAKGDRVAQGNQDIAAHVGTLHFTCKDAIRVSEGEMQPGDVYAVNDPCAGGTYFSDVRLFRAGEFCHDVAGIIAANTRDPESIIGDIHSQASATHAAEREMHRLPAKYGREQDAQRRRVRQGLHQAPDQ